MVYGVSQTTQDGKKVLDYTIVFGTYSVKDTNFAIIKSGAEVMSKLSVMYCEEKQTILS